MGETIGFVGLGQMGRAMAERLGQAGHQLRVWNRTRERAEGIQNATVCATPREAASGAAVVLSSLADDGAVRAVVYGADGVLAGLGEGSPHAGLSTISPALGRELAERHSAAGRVFVSAPVVGRPDAAAHGQLWILTGGDTAAVARCKPIFDLLARGQRHLGDPAQALLAKLIMNFMIAGTIELLGEATALGQKGGISRSEVIGLLTSTLFGAPVVAGYGERIAAGAYQPAGFRMPLGLKDIELALGCGDELRVPLPAGALVRDHLLEALARGRDDWDWSGLAAVAHESAGLEPRPA